MKKKKITPEALAELIQDEGRAERVMQRRIAAANRAREIRLGRLAARREAKAAAWREQRRREKWWRRPNAERQIGKRPGWLVMWERMEPGAWYAWEDLRAMMPEYARGSVRAWPYTKLLPLGLAERMVRGDGVTCESGAQSYWFRRVERPDFLERGNKEG